jgi:hypothetical protein
MNAKIKSGQEITIHRDNTVSYFSIYLQIWRRISLLALTDAHDDFAALTDDDRRRINRALQRQVA